MSDPGDLGLQSDHLQITVKSLRLDRYLQVISERNKSDLWAV